MVYVAMGTAVVVDAKLLGSIVEQLRRVTGVGPCQEGLVGLV